MDHHAHVTRSGEGTVVTFMAGRDGPGKTITATNAAIVLAESISEGRACFVDADLVAGSASEAPLPTPTTPRVTRAVDLDEQQLLTLLTVHPSGIHVLSSQLTRDTAHQPQGLPALISLLRKMFDYIIIDTAPLFDEWLLAILEQSDQVFMITARSLPAVMNAKLTLETLRLLKFPQSKMRLLVLDDLDEANRHHYSNGAAIEQACKLGIAAIIPATELSISESGEKALAFQEPRPDSKRSNAYRAVAGLISTGIAQPSERDPAFRFDAPGNLEFKVKAIPQPASSNSPPSGAVRTPQGQTGAQVVPNAPKSDEDPGYLGRDHDQANVLRLNRDMKRRKSWAEFVTLIVAAWIFVSGAALAGRVFYSDRLELWVRWLGPVMLAGTIWITKEASDALGEQLTKRWVQDHSERQKRLIDELAAIQLDSTARGDSR